MTNLQAESDKGKYVLLFTAVAKPPLPALYIVVFAMYVPCVADGSSLPSN